METRCPNCQNPTPEGAKFCTKCGQAIDLPQPKPSPKKKINATTSTSEEMRCPNCQNPTPEGAKFCTKCGQAIDLPQPKPSPKKKINATTSTSEEMRCPNCQNPTREGEKFCTKCGQAIDLPQPKPTPKKKINATTSASEEMRCPYCQQPILAGMECCVCCGAQLSVDLPPRFCTACGKPIQENANFCTSCGKTIKPLQKPSTKSASRAEKLKTSEKNSEPVTATKEKSPAKAAKKPRLSAEPPKSVKPKTGQRRSPIFTIFGVVLIALIGFGLYRYFSKPDQPRDRWVSKNPTAVVSGLDKAFESFDTIPSALEPEPSTVAVAPDPGDTLIPAPLPVSGSKAVDQELFHGVTVTAEKNQLDRDREFSGYRLTDEEIYEIALPLRDQGYLMIDAFEFSAQLGEGERLPNGVNLHFDLQAFDIPKELWDDIELVRLFGDGQVERLRSKRDGTILTAETDANSIIGAIALGTGIGTVVMKGVEYGGKRSWAQMIWRSFDSSDAHKSFLAGSEERLKNYSIYWPDDLPFSNREKVKEITKELQALTSQHTTKIDQSIWDAKQSGDSIGYSVKIRKALVTMKSDPKYKDIIKRLSDPALVIPLPVQLGIQALVEADYYLYDERQFKRPNHNVEVYFLDDWPHSSNVLGMSENPYLGSPYIHINISKAVGLPFDVAQLKNPDKLVGIRTQIDDMQLTIIHEMFHVVQAGYVWIDKSEYEWFWEATAVLLEKEAYEYGLKNKFKSQKPLMDPQKTGYLMGRSYDDILTTVFWDTYAYSFGNPDDWGKSGDVEKLTTHQGYAASRFLEMLRDKYYRSNPDQFLKDLIDRFAKDSAVRTNIQLLLRDQLGISAKTYETDFVDFCQKETKPIVKEITDKGGFVWKPSLPFLTTQKPKTKIEIADQSDFTAHAQILALMRDQGDSTSYRIGVRMMNYEPFAPSAWIVSDYAGDNLAATEISKDGINYFPYKGSAFAVYTVMSVAPDTEKAAPQMEAILLPQPERPQLEIKGRNLSITMPKKSFLFVQKLAENWLVVFQMKTSTGSTVFAVENNALTLEIPLNENGIIKDPADPNFKDKVIAATTRYAAANPGSTQRTYDWDALQKLADTPVKGKPDVVYTVAVMEMTTEEKPYYTQQSKPASIPVEFEEGSGYLEIISNPCKVDDISCNVKWFNTLLAGYGSDCIYEAIDSLSVIPIEKDGSFSFGAQGSIEKGEYIRYTNSCSLSVNGVIDPRTKKGTATMELNLIREGYNENDRYKYATGCTWIYTDHSDIKAAGEATFDLSEEGGDDFEAYPGVTRKMPSEYAVFHLNATDKFHSENICDLDGIDTSDGYELEFNMHPAIRFRFVPEP